MDPVVPIGEQSYLPSPPLKRVTFAEVKLGKVYYVRHRGRYEGEGWPRPLVWLLATVKTVTDREVVGSPVWYLERGWRRLGVGFSADPATIDTDNGGGVYYHFYVPQEPVGDPTAASVAAAVPVGGAGAPSAPSAADNTAGDPVAPRRLPSRKRKACIRSSRIRKHRRPLKSRK
jgi:hypothetical protein